MNNTESLNKRFSIDNQISFHIENDRPVAHLNHASGEVHISLYGAQVTYYKSEIHEKPVIWMSEHAVFQDSKAIRGGIPICWPWFGAQAPTPGAAAHGFARNRAWEVSASGCDDNGGCWVELLLQSNAETLALWPYQFALTCRITLSDKLHVRLTTVNKDSQAFSLTQALHSYFNVGNIEQTLIQGLENAPYIDTLDNWEVKTDSQSLSIHEEVDRIYNNSAHTCIINDKVFQREIHIAKRGSLSTVVWNPWIDKSQRMKDFGDNEYTGMVCIETANCGEELVHLEPKQQVELETIISVQKSDD